jgi:transcription-repair coupling factor (superfamily II helicase)
MKNLYEAISQKINIEINYGDFLVNVTERLLPLVANILSHKVGKRVEVSVYDQKSNVSGVNQIIKVGEKFNIETLTEFGYTRVPRVWNDKEFSVLGDLVIFQRVGEEFAVRISMFDNIVEEISLVNKDDRSLISKTPSYFLTEDTNILARYCSDYQYSEILNLNFLRNEKVQEGLDIGIREFPGGRFSQIEKIIKSYLSLDFNVYLSTNNDEFEIEGCKKVDGEFPLGFVISKSKIALVTDFELSGRIELFKASTRIKNENLFNEIVRGDYIVHQDHGIGIYQDLIIQDEITYFDIRYAGKDRLLVPVSASDKLSKYVSSGGSTPKLTGLNSVVWGKIKAKALEDIQAMAKELVGIYAMRKISKSSVMVRDHHDEIELGKFVEAFAYADTEDQMVITQEILKDLSKDSPMDRLIVGDVGLVKQN